MSKKKIKEKNTTMTARLTEQLDHEPGEERAEADVLKVMRSSLEREDAPKAQEPLGMTAGGETAVGEKPEDEREILRSVSSALDEDYAEAEELSEETEEAAGAAPPLNRPNRFYLVFAVFIILMSIVGIVTTVRFIADQVESLADQTALKNEIALFLYPVVTVDPPAFASAGEIPESVVIESAVWKIVLTGDITNYEKLYNTYMYVPAVDVEFAARTLFGSEAPINHQTVGSTGSAFNYDEEKNSYLVPITPRYTAYSPSITSISNVGELYTVRVDYLPPTALAIEGIRLESSTTKTMEFTLSKSKNSMTIHSLRNTTKIGDTYAG
ncbi:MAG: hypothetical protein NC084_10555 [Bacteroides sp.]|nr:hypothetical protein [Eubacterium sp.]MCM1419276.1 hypothetical protein [Roseburia sp.]MCM1463138.1 hypothetical protein [Bacteroides sp.]